MRPTLVPLHDFIIKADSTFPSSFSKAEMQELLIDKYKSIVLYAKFLERDLTIDMFEGENKLFEGGRYNDIQPSTEYNYYTCFGIRVFKDSNTSMNCSIGKKIRDLASLNLKLLREY